MYFAYTVADEAYAAVWLRQRCNVMIVQEAMDAVKGRRAPLCLQAMAVPPSGGGIAAPTPGSKSGFKLN